MKFGKIAVDWRRVKTSSGFHNTMMFLVFVAIAAIFWMIIALNDSVTETFRVKLTIQNVPDTVTFINDPPTDIHVTLRDKGTNILRSGVVKNPEVELNFRDYARDGIFRLSAADLNSELKNSFGAGVQISAVSLDSLRLYYTTMPGKRVPVVVNADLTAASGYIISGNPTPLTKSVLIYSYGDETDTVHCVRTQRLVKRNLSQTSTFDVRINRLNNVKIVPGTVKVRVNVESLVHKESYVQVDAEDIPAGMSLLLFPDRVPVSYYVPMSRFNDEEVPVKVVVDFSDTKATAGSRLPVRVKSHADWIINLEPKVDSVEYTLVKY